MPIIMTPEERRRQSINLTNYHLSLLGLPALDKMTPQQLAASHESIKAQIAELEAKLYGPGGKAAFDEERRKLLYGST